MPAPQRSDRDAVVVAARRTAVGTAGRSLARFDTTRLAAPVLSALVADVAALGLPARPYLFSNCNWYWT